ncbi:MAG: alpha/beta fold hydrolase [Chromatiales bacterium]|nr:MAG: alpha/beta fold hydrolase [Chromatiales bacterium]
MSLTRHMVTIVGQHGTRQVHYRRQGDGPAVLLLHQSPQSSREFEPLIAKWSDNFTVIAPDTPGYGLSDPLPARDATMEDLAASVMEFADAIGLGRFGIYGYHTGGGMAVALAHAYPDRITTAAANGLVMPTADELAAILANYLPPFEPDWAGGHLAWLWARLREQTIFFPWHDRRLSTRMDFSVPAADGLQRNVREFLLAAEHYAVAYRAAFAYAAGPVLPQLEVPTLVTAAALDPLAPHLDRIGDRADCVKIEVSSDGPDTIDKAFAQLLSLPGDPAPPAPAAQPCGDGPWQDMLNAGDSPVRLVRQGSDIEVLALHDAGGSALTMPAAIFAMGNVAAMDLPGHGESAPYIPSDEPQISIAACAEAAVGAATALETRPLLAGDGTGALIALEAARQAPHRFRGLLLTNVPALDPALAADWLANGLPSLAADWHGGHLSRAWHMVRDGRLFFPWFRRDRDAIRWVEPDLDPHRLQLEVRELLVAEGYWQALRRMQLQTDVAALLGDCPLPAVLAATASHPLHDPVKATAERQGRHFLSLQGIPGDQATALREAVSRALES